MFQHKQSCSFSETSLSFVQTVTDWQGIMSAPWETSTKESGEKPGCQMFIPQIGYFCKQVHRHGGNVLAKYKCFHVLHHTNSSSLTSYFRSYIYFFNTLLLPAIDKHETIEPWHTVAAIFHWWWQLELLHQVGGVPLMQPTTRVPSATWTALFRTSYVIHFIYNLWYWMICFQTTHMTEAERRLCRSVF